MTIDEVKKYYGNSYKRIIACFDKYDSSFDFDIDTWRHNLDDFDLTVTGKDDNRYIYIASQGSQFTVSYSSQKVEYAWKTIRNQREVIVFLSDLLTRL